MHQVAIVLNVLGLFAALAITGGAAILLLVALHGKNWLVTGLALLVTAGLLLALPIWTLTLAWSWGPGPHYALWIVPGVYLVLAVPLAGALFGAASAAARP